MNYYQRIQKSIDYIENYLETDIKVEDAAKEAFMSISSFHRMFFTIAGYSAKEYIRLRRISLAADEIKTGANKIIDIAVKYAYDSADSFSRAFKNVTGFLPSKYLQGTKDYCFERINIMDKYFEVQDKEMLENYPDIRILKEIKPMRVAYYCYYGENPEAGAFNVINEWVLKNNIKLNNDSYRIFGYNAPDSELSKSGYGYEVCVTIPDDMNFDDEKVKIKNLEGGLYAVTAVDRGDNPGDNIIKAWDRFQKWLEGSKYAYGGHQWLEEHLGFSEQAEHIGGIDLYMPIVLKTELSFEETEEFIDKMLTISCTQKGKNAQHKACKYIFDWAKKNNIDFYDKKLRIFSNYNFEKIGKPDFVYTIYMTIDDSMVIDDKNLEKVIFEGGLYLKRNVIYKNNAYSWFNFIGAVEKSRKYAFGNHKFIEEYLIDRPEINNDTDIAQYMPVRHVL